MYYEAQLEDCDPAKNFVMVGGTNGASHLYQDIIAHFRSRGYCTLNFVPPPPLLPSTLLRLLSPDAKKLLHRTTARTAARRTARASSPRSCSVTR